MAILELSQTGFKEETTWVSVTEYPNEMVCFEGIRTNPNSYTGRDMLSQRILFSKEAIKLIAPALIVWLKEKDIAARRSGK